MNGRRGLGEDRCGATVLRKQSVALSSGRHSGPPAGGKGWGSRHQLRIASRHKPGTAGFPLAGPSLWPAQFERRPIPRPGYGITRFRHVQSGRTTICHSDDFGVVWPGRPSDASAALGPPCHEGLTNGVESGAIRRTSVRRCAQGCAGLSVVARRESGQAGRVRALRDGPAGSLCADKRHYVKLAVSYCPAVHGFRPCAQLFPEEGVSGFHPNTR